MAQLHRVRDALSHPDAAGDTLADRLSGAGLTGEEVRLAERLLAHDVLAPLLSLHQARGVLTSALATLTVDNAFVGETFFACVAELDAAIARVHARVRAARAPRALRGDQEDLVVPDEERTTRARLAHERSGL